MPKSPHLSLLAACVGLMSAAALQATTYVPMADEALADQAELIVDATIAARLPPATAAFPSTDYRLEVLRVLMGKSSAQELVVRVPGGLGADGIAQRVLGAPAFAPGERALLLLTAADDGTWRIVQLMLGAFHRVGLGDRTLALRDLDAAVPVALAEAVDPSPEPVRDYERFAGWLADRADGRPRPADYLLPRAVLPPTAGGTKYGFFHDPLHDLPVRWFEFDQGQAVIWHMSSAGQAGIPGGGFVELGRALAAWSDEVATPIDLLYGGPVATDAGICTSCFDGVNTLLTGDPRQQIAGAFDCRHGGVLAFGGPYFDPSSQGTFAGRTYVRIRGADIVINDGVGCFFAQSRNPSRTAEELFGHELGHTLGLAHASDNPNEPDAVLRDALMYYRLHNDARGARLNVDDRAAIDELYAGQSTADPRSPLAAPTDLVATVVAAHSVTLLWTDTATQEKRYLVEAALAGGSFAPAATGRANRGTVTIGKLRGGTAFTFRVRAQSGRLLGPPSNELTVTTAP